MIDSDSANVAAETYSNLDLFEEDEYYSEIYDLALIGLNSFLCTEKDLQTFDCLEVSINEYFRTEAIEVSSKNISNTTIIWDNQRKRIVGFFTLNSGSYEIQNVIYKNKLKTKTRSQLKVFPVIYLSYFAIDKRYQRKRLGIHMMKEVFSTLFSVSVFVGFVALIVESLHESTEFYEKLGFDYIKDKPGDCGIALHKYDMIIGFDELISTVESEMIFPRSLFN